MTINEVLTEVDNLKPNQYDDAIKIRWISTLEGKLVDEVFDTHELPDQLDIEFTGYTINDMDTELLVPDTYADVYKYYIFAMIDSNNGEAARYAADMSLFNSFLNDFTSYWNRQNLPLSKKLKLF